MTVLRFPASYCYRNLPLIRKTVVLPDFLEVYNRAQKDSTCKRTTSRTADHLQRLGELLLLSTAG